MNKECEFNKSKIPVFNQARIKVFNLVSQGKANYNHRDLSFHTHYKVKHTSIFNFYPGSEPKKQENLCLPKDLYENGYSSFSYRRLKREISQTLMNRRIGKQMWNNPIM